MNFLSPDDIFNGTRRKSLCNGMILTLTSGSNKTDSQKSSSNNKKKEQRRRGSLSEPGGNSSGRRASLVSRWFKHLSDAAEQYKPRSNKNSHDVADDPATATIPHSITKESLESTPERTPTIISNNNQLTRDNSLEKNIKTNLLNNNNNNNENVSSNNRNDLDSNRKSVCRDDNENEKSITDGNINNRYDSIYSNNSNDTRTLMQHCPLLEPSEIQISINPAHTAEPIIMPSERLKRLDELIWSGLAEKQKIICDMFRIPNEHFSAITDIAGQPEAPKDSADIILAAYAQIQSLTEVLTEYMKCSPEQEISAVSTSVCDQCHHKQHTHHEKRTLSPLLSSATTTTATIIDNTVIANDKVIEGIVKNDSSDTIIQEDDGYCEIDELRLPSIMSAFKHINENSVASGHISGNNNSSNNVSQSELTKRQSTISADSIPEETEQDISTQPNDDNAGDSSNNKVSTSKLKEDFEKQKDSPIEESLKLMTAEHIEINDSYDTTMPLNKTNMILSSEAEESMANNSQILCGPNRLSHAASLEPTVPCSVINSIVKELNSQISLLLPKINERDVEREKLRRENQHLRELLNAIHDRKRVEETKETPENLIGSCDKSDETLDLTTSIAGTTAGTAPHTN